MGQQLRLFWTTTGPCCGWLLYWTSTLHVHNHVDINICWARQGTPDHILRRVALSCSSRSRLTPPKSIHLILWCSKAWKSILLRTDEWLKSWCHFYKKAFQSLCSKDFNPCAVCKSFLITDTAHSVLLVSAFVRQVQGQAVLCPMPAHVDEKPNCRHIHQTFLAAATWAMTVSMSWGPEDGKLPNILKKAGPDERHRAIQAGNE